LMLKSVSIVVVPLDGFVACAGAVGISSGCPTLATL